ncbi:hypothetical protein [Candidatus Methylomirabilis sp.]|uniref:Uncharacterized protein n=1 Tax=Candidatus Methylomirabilis tolerans TaxID=3123416 RepID=A0AAJ1AI49_9BACT|nr:hypothetical protein [Candidatus Methylomirabilis sp.]
MAALRYVAVVGSRSLPSSWEPRVASVTHSLLGRGFGIGSGGAVGADLFALRTVVDAGGGGCGSSVVHLPGDNSLAPRDCRPSLVRFAALGGSVVSGSLIRGASRDVAVTALKSRTAALVESAAGVVAFLHGPSWGTRFTLRCALARGLRVVAFVCGGGAVLPAFVGGRWVPLRCSSDAWVGGFRWVPDPESPSPLKSLPEIVRIPAEGGCPIHESFVHVASLSQSDRLWFERCEVVGDTIVAPHPNESDGRPAFLAVPALRKRFGCDAATAMELGELFLALDADERVVAHYVAEAREWGTDTVRSGLFRLVVQLAMLEQADDPMDDADPYQEEDEAEDETSALSSVAYHVVGHLGHEPEVTPWLETQPAWFRDLIGRIDACPSLPALAELGRDVYGMSLTHDQAGAVWTRYSLRKDELHRGLRLSTQAATLLRRITWAGEQTLPRIGTELYRCQRNGLGSLPSHEWAVLWGAYQSRKTTLDPAVAQPETPVP